MKAGSKKLILNIDDDPARLRANTIALQTAGFEVVELKKGKKETRLPGEYHPAAVLTADSRLCLKIAGQSLPNRIYTLQIVDASTGSEIFGDAFIKEPFTARELVRQIEILMRLKKAESKAFEQKNLIQNVTETTPIIFYIFNTATRRNEFITPHTAGALGYTREEFREFDGNFVERLMHPDDSEKLSRHFSELGKLQTGESLIFEYRMRHKSGAWIWLQSRDCVLTRAADGFPERILGVATDVTEQRQSSRRNLIQYEVGRILTGLQTVSEAIPRILETVCRNLDFQLGEFWCFDGEEKVLRLENFWHPALPEVEKFAAESRACEFSKGQGIPGKVWETGEPVWIADLKNEKRLPRKLLLKKTNLQTALGFPILLGGNLFGIFCFLSSERRQVDEALLQMLGALSNHIGQFIKRKKTEGKLRESEERYRTFVQQSSEGIWRFEFDEQLPGALSVEKQIEFALRHGYLAECNDAMAKMYGFEKAEELAGSRISDLFDISDQANFDYFRAFLESGFRLADTESHEKDKNGNDKYFLNSMIGVAENGVLARIWGIQRDITAQKIAEKNLIALERRASEEYLRLLSRIVPLAQTFGAARDLITIFRRIKDFVRDSMPCVGFFISFYEPVGSLRIAAYAWGTEGEVDISMLPPMPIAESGGPNSRAILTGKTQVVNGYMDLMRTRPHVILQEDGIDPQSSLAVPMTVMGRVIGTLEVQAYESGAFREEHIVALEMVANLAATAIENVRLLESEAAARRTAEIANHAKDEFIAIVSHELRSPLNAMLGWARILQNNKVEGVNLDQALETIIRNAKTQSKLIEDLLDTARITSGKLRLEIRPVNLAQIIKSVIDVSRPAAEAKEIDILEELDSSIEPLMGDLDRLQQIVNNLLSNAIKFTQKGANISVRLNREDSNAVISVSDTGIGISREFLPRIFDQFTQSDPASTRRYGGLGIGLALTRKLVELHGGTIKAESEGEGKGATFIVTLPLR